MIITFRLWSMLVYACEQMAKLLDSDAFSLSPYAFLGQYGYMQSPMFVVGG